MCWGFSSMYETLWKSELESDKLGYLAEGISKKSTQGTAWLFLTAFVTKGKKIKMN